VKILLTSCTLNSSLLVLRTLVRNGHTLVAVDDRQLPFGLHSRFVKRYELVPNWREPDYREELLRLVDKHRPDVILPISGAEVVSKDLDKFKSVTNTLVPDYDSFIAVNDKENILKQCRKYSILHAQLIDSIEIAEEKLSSNEVVAVVIKPCINFGGGTGIRFVSDAKEVRNIYHDVEKNFGKCFICEYIPGPDTNNYSLQMVFDGSSNPVCQFAFQKLRISPLRTGVTAVAISKKIPDVINSVMPMLQKLKWKGPLDFDLKMDTRDLQLKVIEVNARFSGAVGFAMGCGIDMPEITCQAAMGNAILPLDGKDYVEGVKYWSPQQYMRSVFQEWRESSQGLITLRDAIKEIKGPRIGSPYNFTDPAPLIGKVLHQIKQRKSS